jgi:2-amino-4-hydroxy-6-hydroxymethyldihydropteridine diphosphokinase
MSTGFDALLLLGGDLGDVKATMDKAVLALERHAGTLLATSRDHWTLPWGFAGHGLFLNRAILLHTTQGPEALMGTLLRIEQDLGRTRNAGTGYGSRSIDIDILLMGDTVLRTPTLTVPHPRMHQRAFALAPAADILPGMVHPTLGRTVLQLLDDLRADTTTQPH